MERTIYFGWGLWYTDSDFCEVHGKWGLYEIELQKIVDYVDR